jgi:hypothetical protein
MAGLVPAIHAVLWARIRGVSGDVSAWMPGTSPGKTERVQLISVLKRKCRQLGLAAYCAQR